MNETDFIQGALSYIALFLLSEGMTLDRNIVIEQGCFAFNYVVGSLFHSFFFIIAKNFSDPDKFVEMNFQFFRKLILIFARNGVIILDTMIFVF